MGYNQERQQMPKPVFWSIITGSLAGIVAILFGIVWLFFMHTESVEPGYHSVINDKPYFFGHEGVRAEPLKEGRILLFRTSTVTPVRMTPQSVNVKVDDYSSKDNILLDFETTIQYRVVDAVTLVSTFGEGWFNNNILNQYLSIVREAVKKHTMAEMMSDVSVARKLDDEITAGLQALIVSGKLPISVISVSTGRAKPNETVLAQMNETANQQQREKSLVAATQAEAQREKEQIAKAKADNAYRNAMQLTPDMFIQLEAIKRFSETCKTSTCIVGAPGVPVTIGKK